MAPMNKNTRKKILNSLRDGLSDYFKTNTTPRYLQRIAALRRNKHSNTNSFKNIKIKKKIKNEINTKKVASKANENFVKKEAPKTTPTPNLPRRPNELELLNDGLTQFYEVSNSKRSSVYRALRKNNLPPKSQISKALNRSAIKKTSSTNNNNFEEPQSPKIRKNQLEILSDGLSGYFSTGDKFRKSTGHYGSVKHNSKTQNSNGQRENEKDTLQKKQLLLNQVEVNLTNCVKDGEEILDSERIKSKNEYSTKNNNEKFKKLTPNNTKFKKIKILKSNKEIRIKKIVKNAKNVAFKNSRFDQLQDGLSNYFKTNSKTRTRFSGNEKPQKPSSDEDDNSNDISDENGINGKFPPEEDDSTEQDDSKCHQILGLFDGLSHLYCPGGTRVRKSQNFYKESSYYKRTSEFQPFNDSLLDNKKSNKKGKNGVKFGKKLNEYDKKLKQQVRKRKNGNIDEVIKRKYIRKNFNGKAIKGRNKGNNKGKNNFILKKFSKNKKNGLHKMEVNRFKCFDLFPQITSTDKLLFKKATKKAIKMLTKSNDLSLYNSNYPLSIELGQYDVATWFPSFYPGQFSMCQKLYICEFCLKYMQSQETLQSHLNKCLETHPPGLEIYKHGGISVWQVDGNVNKNYCRNLCLLAKLFLQHKTLYLDVEPFLFYVLTLNDARGSHLVGYFSKEKFCPQRFNLSCLMVLPQFQRQGYGRLLIHFSYLLTKKEGMFGSPEKPLSELGRLTYMEYWKGVVVSLLHCARGTLSIRDISLATGITGTDVISTLEALHLIAKLDDAVVLAVDRGKLKVMFEDLQKRNVLTLNEECLRWKPLQF